MTETMTAIEIAEPGGPEVLRPAERPRPAPGVGELLIEVAAAGVNRPDVLQRQGGYPPPPGASDFPGLEVAGTVAALGPGAHGWQIGDPVCALVSGGGYAEFCAAPTAQCLPVPEGFDMVQAAALPETFFTVWTNVFQRGRLRAGERFLVHGGSSGIGTTAIQIASARGARVFATAGTADKCAACERSAPSARSTTATRTSSPSSSRRPAAKASTSSSTWSAATTSSATSRRCAPRAASSTSPSSAGPRPRSTSCR